MSFNQKLKEINSALSTLGVVNETIDIKTLWNQSKIYVNQEYFGIYDHNRKTFVD